VSGTRRAFINLVRQPVDRVAEDLLAADAEEHATPWVARASTSGGVGDQGGTTGLFDPRAQSPPQLAGGVRVAGGSQGRVVVGRKRALSSRPRSRRRPSESGRLGAAQAYSSCCGGPRAGARGRDRAGRRRCWRISRATVDEKTHAATRRGPPHLSHVRTSVAKVVWSSWAHGTRYLVAGVEAGLGATGTDGSCLGG
jgi:hypothetical protein